MPEYLREWVIFKFGKEPISFPRGSVENDLIELGLTKLPENKSPDVDTEGKVSFEIPSFRYKKPGVYNYFPTSAKASLVRCLHSQFEVALFTELMKFKHIGSKKQDIIMTWMEANGITCSDRNFNSVVKIYQRKRKAYLQKKLRKNG